MKKLLIALLLISVGFSVGLFALGDNTNIGISVYNGDDSGIAMIGIHSNMFYSNLGFSMYSDDSASKSEITSVLVLGGMKSKISDDLYFTYGTIFNVQLGKVLGINIDNAVAYGITVGLQYSLNEKLLFDVKYVPITLSSFKVLGTTTKKTSIGRTVLIGATYLF